MKISTDSVWMDSSIRGRTEEQWIDLVDFWMRKYHFEEKSVTVKTISHVCHVRQKDPLTCSDSHRENVLEHIARALEHKRLLGLIVKCEPAGSKFDQKTNWVRSIWHPVNITIQFFKTEAERKERMVADCAGKKFPSSDWTERTIFHLKAVVEANHKE